MIKHLVLPPPLTIFYANFPVYPPQQPEQFSSMCFVVAGHVAIHKKIAYDLGEVSAILGNGWLTVDFAHLALPENVLKVYLKDANTYGSHVEERYLLLLEKAGWQKGWVCPPDAELQWAGVEPAKT